MSLPALFSLIFAALLSLLPIFLLLGRRIGRSRRNAAPGADMREGRLPSDADLAEEPGGGQPVAGAGDEAVSRAGVSRAGEGPVRGILERLVRGGARPQNEPRREVQRPALEARSEVYPRPEVMQRTGSERPGAAPQPVANPGPVGSQSDTSGAAMLERRLRRLSPLQRAVVYRELLGPPVALADLKDR